MTYTKKILSILIAAATLSSCKVNVGSEHHEEPTADITRLAANETQFNAINQLGEVDWYEYQLTKADSLITVNISSDTRRSDVDLLSTLYRKDAAGNLSRLYADHTPENSINGTELNLVYQFSQKETIWVAVRDYLDDEASDSEYSIKVTESRSDYKNNSATGAVILPLDNDAGCHIDRIDSIGDIDNYRIDIKATNVYTFQSVFNAKKDTDVKLKLQLFNELMQLVNADWVPTKGLYSINSYLIPGTYYITVEDFGRDHFDLSSSYTLCANTENNVEAGLNNSQHRKAITLFQL